jgi:threonine dehydrogenase-like Zn-dependent dehydrogenase
MRPSPRRIKSILSLIIFLNFTLVIGSPLYFIHSLNPSLRRLKAVSVERMALAEILNPGPVFLASVKGAEPFSQEIKYLPTPQISADEILIVPLYIGICATDIDIYTNVRPAVPGVMGHEVVAQVIRVGENVKDVKTGDLITMNPNDPLSKDNIIGFNGTGFLGRVFKIPKEFVFTSEKTIFRIPAGLSFMEAVFTEPLSTVHFAQDVMKEDILGKRVVVVGGGSTGDLHVLWQTVSGRRCQVLTADGVRS